VRCTSLCPDLPAAFREPPADDTRLDALEPPELLVGPVEGVRRAAIAAPAAAAVAPVEGVRCAAGYPGVVETPTPLEPLRFASCVWLIPYTLDGSGGDGRPRRSLESDGGDGAPLSAMRDGGLEPGQAASTALGTLDWRR